VNVTSTAGDLEPCAGQGHAVGEAQLVKVGEAGAGPDTLASPQSTMVNRN
jgi:hypothetical protein